MSGGSGSAPTNGFRPVRVTRPPLHQRPRAACLPPARAFHAVDGFTVVLLGAAAEQLEALGRAAAPAEWYGVLLGFHGEDAEGRYVLVEAVVPDLGASASASRVDTTAATELATRALAARLHPGRAIVGWAHGHVRCGTEYSGTDRRNQATWTDPCSVGIVVDPWAPERFGVYRGPSSERLRLGASSPSTSHQGVERDVHTRPPAPARGRSVATRAWHLTGALASVVSLVVCVVCAVRIERRMARLQGRLEALEARAPVTHALVLELPLTRAASRTDTPEQPAMDAASTVNVDAARSEAATAEDAPAVVDAAPDARSDATAEAAAPIRATSRRGAPPPARDRR